MSVAAVVLAAGASTRLGHPKQSVLLQGETLLRRAVRIAHEAGLEPIFAVISQELSVRLSDQEKLHGAILLINEIAEEGIASSIRQGVEAAMASGVSGVIILACDQVAVTSAHLESLAVGDQEICASSYAERNGIPAYFPRAAAAALLALRGDTGARDLLRTAKALSLRDGELDIDTPDDLARARLLYPDEPWLNTSASTDRSSPPTPECRLSGLKRS